MTKSVEQARRELFEAWHCKTFKTKYSCGQPTRDMHNGIYAERYTNQAEQERWESFNAALDSVVIDFPFKIGDDNDFDDGYVKAVDDCRAAIATTGLGLKTK